MASENKIISSLKESFLIIKKNKRIFLLVFILQVLFISFVIAANAYYVPRILQSIQDAIGYAEALNINPEAGDIGILQQKSPLGEDPLLISRNYSLIIKNSISLLVLIFLIFAVVNGLAWYFASNIAEKRKKLFSLKGIFPYMLKFFIMSVFLSFFIYLLAYNLVNIAFSGYLSVKPMDFIPLLLIVVMAIYFIHISVPILDKIRLKETPKKIIRLGAKKFVPVIISYLIILIFIMASLFLIFYFIELNLFLLLASVLLSIFVFAWSKIFFAVIIRKLSGL
ncbi:hypothetical protein HYU09_00965 [Candidatus Woesearchaeota archaeon]|nr:hypothetical protein [Candidatus Woesearchaeota archaeon]